MPGKRKVGSRYFCVMGAGLLLGRIIQQFHAEEEKKKEGKKSLHQNVSAWRALGDGSFGSVCGESF